MAESTQAATGTKARSSAAVRRADLERAQEFTREPILLDGEKLSDLAPGSARRLAVDSALEEITAGRENPSIEWRRDYSLLLGLERLLSEETPHLADGAELSAHQVDALSGTLAALTTEVEDPGANGRSNGRSAAPRPPADGANGDGSPNDGSGVAEEDEVLAPDEEPQDWEDPGASRRFWFEHATGAGKTVAAVGFIEASRTGGILILTHRRNLVNQFIGEIKDRGYGDRLAPPLMDGADHPYGPAPVYTGMPAPGALIARHVADLFPTQTSRFDLAQAARRGVIAPLRCIRIPPGPGVRTIAKVPLRKGEVDQDFDQEELAALLDQEPFNVAIADLYRSRFRKIPGVVYTAGVQHAKNVAKAFRDAGINAQAVSGETPKRELAEILAGFERGTVDVLCNAMLLAEGWNSPRATICMHLAPTASRRIYQQRVGRVTRRAPGKEAGLVLDFVHPATTHDETIVTLHSLLDRDVYRGGAIVVGPVRRGRGRKVRVERRIVPVSDDEERRTQVLERELWRIAVENLNYSEQHAWAALAGARVTPNNWRRAKAMIQHDQSKELRKRFLLTCVQRNRNHQLRLKALAEIAALRDPDSFDEAIDMVGGWSRDDKRAGTKVLLQALAERRIGRRDQAQAWVWRLASFTRELHEEYAVQRWPETKRLLGLFVNSSGRAHGRNARRIVHAARQHDRRLAVSLLAAAVAHTPEAEEALRGARMRTSRKPSAAARELLRNFPRSGGRRRRRRSRSGGQNGEQGGGDAGAREAEKATDEAE